MSTPNSRAVNGAKLTTTLYIKTQDLAPARGSRKFKRLRKKLLKQHYKDIRHKELASVPKLKTDFYGDWNNPYQHVDGCGIVLLKIVNVKVLMLLRKCNNIYYVPKGHRKKNETFLEGAKRELHRYCNINPDQYTLLPTWRQYDYSQCYYHKIDVTKHARYYFALDISDEENIPNIPNNIYGSYHWIDIDDFNVKIGSGYNNYERNIGKFLPEIRNFLK